MTTLEALNILNPQTILHSPGTGKTMSVLGCVALIDESSQYSASQYTVSIKKNPIRLIQAGTEDNLGGGNILLREVAIK